jgi:hypothetical protein
VTPGFSMTGSGIYSETVTREIVCAERCGDCEQAGKSCESVWEQDMETDDWGNLDQDVTCKLCEHTINYTEERE